MAAETEPYGRRTQKPPAVKEVHILWTPDGLSCDGDTVSVTAATQPSIEDIVMGAIPGLPKVHLHNRVLAPEVATSTCSSGMMPPRASSSAVHSRRRGFDPQRGRSRARATGPRMGNDERTGQPITLCEWIDRLAPKALAVVAAGTCATYGGIHAMAGNPTGAWVWPTTSAGAGVPKPVFPSSTSPAVRCSPII